MPPAESAPKPAVYLVSEDIRTALLNYLATRPYQEVHAAIAIFQNLPVAQLADEHPAKTVPDPDDNNFVPCDPNDGPPV